MRRSQAFGLAAAAAAAALVFTAAAGGKDFRPGDLRVCNARTCVAITDQQVLDQLSAFYYGSSPPARTRAPRPGVLFFQLRFPNGYVTGIVSTSRLDRFLSYGVNLDQFRRGRWYAVPAQAAAGLRTATTGLKPLRLTQAAEAKSH